MSYIILGRPGEALCPYVANGINFLKQTNIYNLGIKKSFGKTLLLILRQCSGHRNKACNETGDMV